MRFAIKGKHNSGLFEFAQYHLYGIGKTSITDRNRSHRKKSFAEDPSRLFRPNIHPMPAETLPPMSTVDKRWSATPRRGDISRRLLPIAYAFSGEQCLEMSIDFTHTTLDVELAISQYFFPYTINVVFPSSQSFDDNFFFLCASQSVTEVQIVIDSKFDFMWSGCSSERMM